MSKISFKPADTGTATFTIEAPATNTNRTLTLPDEAGSVLTNGGAINVDQSAPTESAVIDSSGNLGIGTSSPAVALDVSGQMRASSGILFGADTAASNTLDDYETGTWTPTITINPGTATTYASFDAIYTKMGSLVSVALKIRGTNGTIGEENDYMQLSGLPFAVSGINAGPMVDGSNLASSGGCLAFSTDMQIHFRNQLAVNTSAFVALVYRT